jgi:methylglutaconyl-CoA hydratase
MRLLLTRRDGPIEYITLNRPDVRNAINDTLIAELTTWAETAAADPSLRVAVLAGSGRVFSAGADIDWMTRCIRYTHEENIRDALAVAAMFDRLDTLPCALIGRIQGAAMGGGAGLVAVCDIAVAADTTQFAFSEARLGIVPATISPYVVAKIGLSAARELFVTGDRFTAARARELGLVHAVVAEGDLDTSVAGFISSVLASGPAAVRASKTLIRAVAAHHPHALGQLTADTLARHRVSAEGQEGLKAFLEKRKPEWAGE